MLEGLHTIFLPAILKNHINEKSCLPYDRSQEAEFVKYPTSQNSLNSNKFMKINFHLHKYLDEYYCKESLQKWTKPPINNVLSLFA